MSDIRYKIKEATTDPKRKEEYIRKIAMGITISCMVFALIIEYAL